MQKFTDASGASPAMRILGSAWLSVGLLLLASLAAYHATFAVPFLLDDYPSILENESVHRLGSWWAALSPRSQVYTAGRPLLNLSFALNYAAGGFSVTGYHVLNLCIHAAAAVTLWAIVRETLSRHAALPAARRDATPIATVAALFWTLHPVQTVSVTYISQRAESLMALCYLLTLYCFLRATAARTWFWTLLTVATCAAGMMVKEVMVTAPVVVLLFDATLIAGSFRAAWRERKALYLGFVATQLVLFALMFGTRLTERGVGFGITYSWFDYARIESSAVLHYLRLAVWPFPLVFDYGQEAVVPGGWAVARNIVVLSAIVIAIVRGLRHRTPIALLGCCYFIILAPTSSVVPVAAQPVAENRLYLPLAAVGVLIAIGLGRAGRTAIVGGFAAALALGVAAIARNRDYQDEVRLWAGTVAQRPDSSRAHANLGDALLRAKRTDEGVRQLETAIRLNPGYVVAHAQLAAAYFAQGRHADASRHFEIALAADSSDPTTHSNYGATLFQLGRWNDALAQFLEALRLRPTHAPSRDNAAILLARLGRPAEAIAMFEETLRMYPEDPVSREQLAQLRAAIQSGTYKPVPPTP